MKIAEDFVDYIFKICNQDKAIRADLRHSSSDIMQWHSWSVIAPFLKHFESDSVGRDIFSMIASDIALSKQENNGNIHFGKAMALVEKDSNNVSRRFRRIISSSDFEDLLPALKSALKLIRSKGVSLDYKSLLSDLIVYRSEDRRVDINAKWMSEYLKKEESIDVSE